MLRIGTTFSGVGAIEHAIQRLNIPHKIVFACDNGGVDIFEKNIEDDFISIYDEIIYLKTHIEKLVSVTKDEYNVNLLNRINFIETQYQEAVNKANELTIKNQVIEAVQEALDFLNINNDMKFNIADRNDSTNLILVAELKKYLEKKYNNTVEIVKKLELLTKNKEYRAIRREIKELPKSLSQLHSTIRTQEELVILSQIESFKDKKAYIDSLYSHKENSNFVKKMYLANYEINSNDFHWNVNLMDGNQYRNQIDLFVGGSPCQSFSIVGKRGGFEDTRGTLFYEYVRILKETNPRFFIYENVKGVLSHDDGQTWEVMKNTFEDTGYKYKYFTLNAREFGIPQNRERIFVIGFKEEKDFEKFQEPQKKELTLKMKDLLEDYVDEKYFLPEKGIKFVTDEKNLSKRYTQVNGDIALCQTANQQFNWHGDFIEEYTEEELYRMSKIDDKYFLSKKVKDYILSDEYFMNNKPDAELIDLDIARPLTATMHKMHRAGVDNYVSYGKSLPAKDRRIRKLTPRECFRLMGFSDEFKLVVSDTQLYHQAGNSIVVDVLISIMEEILKVKE